MRKPSNTHTSHDPLTACCTPNHTRTFPLVNHPTTTVERTESLKCEQIALLLCTTSFAARPVVSGLRPKEGGTVSVGYSTPLQFVLSPPPPAHTRTRALVRMHAATAFHVEGADTARAPHQSWEEHGGGSRPSKTLKMQAAFHLLAARSALQDPFSQTREGSQDTPGRRWLGNG